MSTTSVRKDHILIVAVTQGWELRGDRRMLVAYHRHLGLFGTTTNVCSDWRATRNSSCGRSVRIYWGPAALKGEAHATSPSFCKF